MTEDEIEAHKAHKRKVASDWYYALPVTRVTCVNPNCGKVFDTRVVPSKGVSPVRCHPCRNYLAETGNERVPRFCAICMKELKGNRQDKYCSSKCRDQGNTDADRMALLKCEVCAKHFKLYVSTIKNAKKKRLVTRGRFCSNACKGEWMKADRFAKFEPTRLPLDTEKHSS